MRHSMIIATRYMHCMNPFLGENILAAFNIECNAEIVNVTFRFYASWERALLRK
ncbi:hypothetical protein Syn8016DRAFT_1460 [Synechococcus sp. WH 8016]|nr:hypothetical protein Syn8016DRAFT_1460 [Synechococcus sp. WH 8016]